MRWLGPAIFVLVGVGLCCLSAALTFNLRGATDWWLSYSQRQREWFGRSIGPTYTRSWARLLGLITVGFGAMFIVTGLFA